MNKLWVSCTLTFLTTHASLTMIYYWKYQLFQFRFLVRNGNKRVDIFHGKTILNNWIWRARKLKIVFSWLGLAFRLTSQQSIPRCGTSKYFLSSRKGLLFAATCTNSAHSTLAVRFVHINGLSFGRVWNRTGEGGELHTNRLNDQHRSGSTGKVKKNINNIRYWLTSIP